jgi:hypothetical protein
MTGAAVAVGELEICEAGTLSRGIICESASREDADDLEFRGLSSRSQRFEETLKSAILTEDVEERINFEGSKRGISRRAESATLREELKRRRGTVTASGRAGSLPSLEGCGVNQR